MYPWPISVGLSILAVWAIFATTTSDAQILAASSPMKNAAGNQPPFCVYPPPSATPTPLPPPFSSPPAASSSPPSPPAASTSPPNAKGDHGSWCVATPAAAATQLQQALDYACSTGADCAPIQPSGACFQPDSVIAHASYAFNSYWQRTKKAGGTCDFGGTAMVVTADPSYDQCHFLNS